MVKDFQPTTEHLATNSSYTKTRSICQTTQPYDNKSSDCIMIHSLQAIWVTSKRLNSLSRISDGLIWEFTSGTTSTAALSVKAWRTKITNPPFPFSQSLLITMPSHLKSCPSILLANYPLVRDTPRPQSKYHATQPLEWNNSANYTPEKLSNDPDSPKR